MKMSLDSILLFPLVIFFIMNYRLSPGDTPYWLFGLIFLGLFFYITTDILNLKQEARYSIKNFLLCLLIFLTIGSAYFSAITVRHQTSPIYNIHDIVIQQESAIRFLLHGKNPYSSTYFGTPLEKWNYSDTEKNPALYHFVMEPFYLLFSIPFYLISTRTIGFFDGRMPLIFLFFALLFMAWKRVKDNDKRLLFITLLSFNPATLGYLLEGRDDIFMFAFLFAGLFLLFRNRDAIGGVFFALAFAIKQSAWLIFPFYIAYLYFKNKNFKKTILRLIPFLVTFSIIVLPFVLWDSKAFFSSTVFYLSGNDLHSYPIAGYGFGKLLNQIGVIKDVHHYYPFWIWQVLIGVPLLIYLIKFQKQKNNTQRLILSYGVFLFVFWYFSRYFNNSHLGFLSMIFITSYFWPEKQGT